MAAAKQMIIFIAILTGGPLGGCKPLIKAFVNDAESAVEIKARLFPFFHIAGLLCGLVSHCNCFGFLE